MDSGFYGGLGNARFNTCKSFIYIIKGQFDFSALLGTFTGAAILIIINVAIVHLIKDKAHENR